MDLLGIGSILGGVLGFGSNLISNFINKNANDEANRLTQENNQFQKDVFNQTMDWTKYQQEQTWNREDTSYQRTKDDLVKAGYSPLAINGTNDSGSLASIPNAPELQGINPYQIGDMGLGQLSSILASADEREIMREENEIKAKSQLSDEKYKEWQKTETERHNKKLEKQADTAQEQALSIARMNNATNLIKTISGLQKANKDIELAKNRSQVEDAEKYLKAETGGRGHIFYCKTKNEYNERYAQWQEDRAKYWQDTIIPELQKDSSRSHGQSQTLQGSATVVSAQKGDSSNWSFKNEVSDRVQEMINDWYGKNPVPYYIGYWYDK